MPRKKETIWCIIPDQLIPFSIKIESSESVDDLKTKIHEVNKNTFAEIAAHQLKLYHTEISVHDDMVKAIKQALSQDPDELEPWKKLATVFNGGLKEEAIHIIVQLLETSTYGVLRELCQAY